jgi:hypothetical protein
VSGCATAIYVSDLKNSKVEQERPSKNDINYSLYYTVFNRQSPAYGLEYSKYFTDSEKRDYQNKYKEYRE